MNKTEKKTALSLAAIFAFRMLGLFMILPTFALYAQQLHHITPTLIGVALGIYGLTQACLQIPFGFLSDRFGRKPLILIGLILFAIGSVVAALSHSIWGIIIGRALQGSGAVGSVTLALLTDLIREEQRTKAMAIVGMMIGLSFAVAMVLGPIISAWFSVSGIFWLTSLLALAGIAILFTTVPTPTHCRLQRDAEPVPQLIKSMLSNGELLRLNFGIFTLHAVLTASFLVVPIALQRVGLVASQQWLLYLPVLVLAFFTMFPFIIMAEKRRQMKTVFSAAIAVLIITQLLLWVGYTSSIVIAIALFLFFTAFTLLEASLPSLIAKTAPAGSKGTAMGIYSSSQFLGIFVGGSVGGWLYSLYSFSAIFLGGAILLAIWLVLAIGMKKPRYLATYTLNIGRISSKQAGILQQQLLNTPGVADALILVNDGVAYLKINNRVVDKKQLQRFSVENDN
ncbi:MAG: MFS transporter [Gammaproteobacteria bacterium]|nr:MFS transporter [Gammaproteobacteria bacterium]